MRSIKTFGVAIVATLALSGIAAAAATAAPQFYLSEGTPPGTTITSTEPFTGTLLSTTAVLSSKVAGTKIKLSATGSVSEGSIDNAEAGMGQARSVKIHYTNVTTNVPNCGVEDTTSLTPGTITTNTLAGTAVENGLS